MNRYEQERLWREIVHDDALERLRETTLAAGARNQRTRRYRRLVQRAVVLVGIVVVTAWLYRRPTRMPETMPRTTPMLATSTVPPHSHVRIIDDSELLAHFADRGAALAGPADARRLIIFGRSVD